MRVVPAGLVMAGLALVLGTTPTAPVTASPAATMATAPAGPGDESRDFRFPGADLMRIPGTKKYVAYGASFGGRKLPYTVVRFADGGFRRRAAVDGDAWQRRDVRFPTGYWAERGSTLWTPAVFPHRERGRVVYYVFYSARVRGTDTGRRCIGYATSLKWNTGWRASRNPVFCPKNRWAIDADITTGPNGRAWMSLRNGAWTKDGFTALGASPLTFDDRRHVRLARSPRLVLRNTRLEWTYHDQDPRLVKTIENPNAVYLKRRWYLFYSGNYWASNYYATGLAFCGKQLVDARCRPIDEPRAYFAYAPPSNPEPGFEKALPAGMRKKTLPGNKRGPGAFDAFRAPDGTWWASWNYIRDDTTGIARRSRIAPLAISGSGRTAKFSVTWRR